MAESGVRLSADWSLSTLPEVTSSHKAALSHKSLPSDASRVYHYTLTMNFKINTVSLTNSIEFIIYKIIFI